MNYSYLCFKFNTSLIFCNMLIVSALPHDSYRDRAIDRNLADNQMITIYQVFET